LRKSLRPSNASRLSIAAYRRMFHRSLGRALWTGIADRIQHVANGSNRPLRGDTGRRLVSRDAEGALASMGIAAIFHPAMLFAFADRTDLKEDHPGPSLYGPKRRLAFLHHQHCNHFPRARYTNPWDRQPFLTINAGQRFPIITAPAAAAPMLSHAPLDYRADFSSRIGTSASGAKRPFQTSAASGAGRATRSK
jgi:hypothetical protein